MDGLRHAEMCEAMRQDMLRRPFALRPTGSPQDDKIREFAESLAARFAPYAESDLLVRRAFARAVGGKA